MVRVDVYSKVNRLERCKLDRGRLRIKGWMVSKDELITFATNDTKILRRYRVTSGRGENVKSGRIVANLLTYMVAQTCHSNFFQNFLIFFFPRK